MSRFLNALVSIFIKIALIALFILLIFYEDLVKMGLQNVYYDFDKLYRPILIIIIAIYFLLIIYTKLFGHRKSILTNTVNGRVEISYNTVESIIENYLLTQDIVEKVKVKIYKNFKYPRITVNISCYKTNNLSEKLDKIKAELDEHIEQMIGIRLEKISLKVVKISDKVEDKGEF